ncbi:MipA/OmpV family protein [Solimonas sp. K1W22B-7]|uniref:MipA/OmpV family protein n=1 Tax=Solimonas sp. K1W22B-7 TaxID=2303331 RepID=UPI000E332397|nr:MipA/OmpV family protein [Solimonas sp. K1W22B-7]AXQ29537.1 MipA/OmpV family protein [Solimonas sp. K1W22B-7]
MKFINKSLVAVLLATGSLPALAAEGDYVSFGAGVLLFDQVYEGSDADVVGFPFVQGQYGDFFLQGLTMGWSFLREDAYRVSLLGNFRLNSLESGDLDPALAIDERKRTFEAGVGVTMPLGERLLLDSHALFDVLDRHGGYELGLRLSRPTIVGDFLLAPNIGVSLLSEDFTAYYYGLKPGEAGFAGGYEPGNVVVPQLGFSAIYPITPSWTATGLLGARYLGSDIEDSPLVDAEWESTLFLGVSYRLPL